MLRGGGEIPEDAEDVVGGHDKHKKDEEEEADRVDRLCDNRLYGPADDAFNNDENEPAAVKRGDRDEIDEREIDRNDRHDGKEMTKSLCRSASDDTCDADGSRDLRDVGRESEDAGEEVIDRKSTRLNSSHSSISYA